MLSRFSAIVGFWICAGPMRPMAQGAGIEPQRWRGYVHANGYTHHFAAPDANDELFGTGVTWYTRKWGRVQTAWEADVFRDSACELCGYAGYSATLPFRFASIGATGAIMYHRNFVAQNPYRILPVALPFAETTIFRGAKLRAYYVPPVRSRRDEQIALQILIPFKR